MRTGVLLGWPRLDLAAKLVVKWRAEWEVDISTLLAAAEASEPDHPAAAAILSAPFSTISRSRSISAMACGSVSCKTDALAAYEGAADSMNAHQIYRTELAKKHGTEKRLLESRQGAQVKQADLAKHRIHAASGAVVHSGIRSNVCSWRDGDIGRIGQIRVVTPAAEREAVGIFESASR